MNRGIEPGLGVLTEGEMDHTAPLGHLEGHLEEEPFTLTHSESPFNKQPRWRSSRSGETDCEDTKQLPIAERHLWLSSTAHSIVATMWRLLLGCISGGREALALSCRQPFPQFLPSATLSPPECCTCCPLTQGQYHSLSHPCPSHLAPHPSDPHLDVADALEL